MRALVAVVLTALVAGCGSSAPARDFSPVGGIGGLPDVKVVDLASGKKVSLGSLPSGRRAALVWFWAPESAASRRDAPRVERFAREHAATIEVIGLGARDDRDAAEEFVRELRIRTPRMVYDGSRESWKSLGVSKQPAAILLDRAGREVRRWYGPLEEQAVLTAAARVD